MASSFVLNFDTDGAVFTDDPVLGQMDHGAIVDINGNRVGGWVWAVD